jgi:hypothetical protein
LNRGTKGFTAQFKEFSSGGEESDCESFEDANTSHDLVFELADKFEYQHTRGMLFKRIVWMKSEVSVHIDVGAAIGHGATKEAFPCVIKGEWLFFFVIIHFF